MDDLDEMFSRYFEAAGLDLNEYEEQLVVDHSLMVQEALDHTDIREEVIIDLFLLTLGHIENTVPEEHYTEDFQKVREVWSGGDMG